MGDNLRFTNRFNVHGIIDFDKIGVLLTNLIQHIEKQDETIVDLKRRIAESTPLKTFNEKFSALEDVMQQTKIRIDAVQDAATARVGDKRISAGDLATSNYQQIKKLSNIVSGCISRAEVEKIYTELKDVEVEVNKIQEDIEKTLKITDQFNIVQTNQHKRITTLETTIVNKLDRSELAQLEALVAKIALYDEFKKNCLLRLDKLQRASMSLQDTVNTHDDHLQRVDGELGRVEKALQLTATKQEMYKIGNQVEKHIEVLNNCVRMSTFSQLRKEVEDSIRTLNQTVTNITKIQVQLEVIGTQISERATIRMMEERVHNEKFDKLFESLTTEVDKKTYYSFSNEMFKNVKELEEKVNSESEKLRIALRFVDWFTNRGENYEHNMKIIDKHLKGLITSSHSSSTHSAKTHFLPFDQVQFQSNDTLTSRVAARARPDDPNIPSYLRAPLPGADSNSAVS